MSLAENINLPPSLLSRFDLVYLVLDSRCDASHSTGLGIQHRNSHHVMALILPVVSV
jgi:DNA replicative helicase MCM subunit Mcm2 (Cdc46/Mcm family)